jgi:hypothetical protein
MYRCLPPQPPTEQQSGFWDFVAKAALLLGLLVSVRSLMR